MSYPGGAPVTIVGGQTGGAAAGSTANPFATTNSTGGTAANPTFQREVGAPTFVTGQAASSISPAAATQIVGARSGRRSVTLTNITGTQPVYFTATAVTNGVATGFFLAGNVGASISIGTQSAIFATSPTAAQNVAFAETY